MATGDLDNHSGVIEVTAPTGGYTKGLIYQLASGGYVAALETISATATGLVFLLGTPGKVVEVTKNSGTGEGGTQGGLVYVNGSNQADANATSNTLLNCVVWAEDAGAADTTGKLVFCATADVDT